MTKLEEYLEFIIPNPLYTMDEQTNTNEPEKIPRWQRIAYLLFCNDGNFEVNSFGNISQGEHIYKTGLIAFEAFELTAHGAVLHAASWYEPETWNIKYFLMAQNHLGALIDECEKNKKVTKKLVDVSRLNIN